MDKKIVEAAERYRQHKLRMRMAPMDVTADPYYDAENDGVNVHLMEHDIERLAEGYLLMEQCIADVGRMVTSKSEMFEPLGDVGQQVQEVVKLVVGAFSAVAIPDEEIQSWVKES